MEQCWIVRYGEISLKGGNRPEFEKRLVGNLKACLASESTPYQFIERHRGRIIILSDQNCRAASRVFGVVSISPAIRVSYGDDCVQEMITTLCKPLTSHSTFRVSARRLDKKYPLTSQELMIRWGSSISAMTTAKVRLTDFDYEISLETSDGMMYGFLETVSGVGGISLGMSAPVQCLFGNEASSIVSAWLVMKRGCPVILVGYPVAATTILERYSYGSPLICANNLDPTIPLVSDVSLSQDSSLSFPESPLHLTPLITCTKEEVDAMYGRIQKGGV